MGWCFLEGFMIFVCSLFLLVFFSLYVLIVVTIVLARGIFPNVQWPFFISFRRQTFSIRSPSLSV